MNISEITIDTKKMKNPVNMNQIEYANRIELEIDIVGQGVMVIIIRQ